MAQAPDFKLPFNDLINYVPLNLRDEVITSLIDNLFNRQMTHDESVPLYGYVGVKPTSKDDRSPRVPQMNVERDINSIVPVISFTLGTEKFAFTVEDLVRKAEAIGITDAGQQWLYSQGNNFAPPIDFDKFTNFFNYYWTAKAVAATPDMPWNPELLPEYYTIATPRPGDQNKLNARVATTGSIVMTGTGFPAMSFKVLFTTPTHFTVTPQPAGVIPDTWSGDLTTNDDQFSFASSGKTLLTFNIAREPIINYNGDVIGTASFDAGDYFTVTPTFLSHNYIVSFVGTEGVKGKLYKVSSLNEYQTIDGVQLQLGDRVLVKDGNPADTGIYVVAPGVWARAADYTGSYIADGARVYVTSGTQNGGMLFTSAFGGTGWTGVPSLSNTNSWQEGNYWVHGDDLAGLGLSRSTTIQAVRPIIEYTSDLQLNGFVKNGRPSDSGAAFKQVKTEFNQLPMFDLFRYDGTHSGLVSSVFFYEEDPTATLDIDLQKRPLQSNNDSADFVFNHGMADANGQLLFVKAGNQLKTIWHAGYNSPTIAGIYYGGAGNGTITNAAAINFSQQQIWTLTAQTSTTFSMQGSKMPDVPDIATVGVPFNNGYISFTINAGSIPFTPGDTFLIAVGNLESPRYVFRDADNNIVDFYGGPEADTNSVGAWQVPRTFYNNPYNESQSPLLEGTLYSHFRGILQNQLPNSQLNLAFGGSIKLWSEQQTLLASLLMQRDMTPISMIDLAERQYEVALNTVRDIYQQHIVQYMANNGPVTDINDLDALLAYVESVRAADNDVRTVLYDSTASVVGFPATLPQLGILDLVQPTIRLDGVLNQLVLVHHDGHESPLVVDSDEFRQSILGNLTSLQILRSDGIYTGAVGSFTNTPPALPYKGQLWIPPGDIMYAYNVVSDKNAPTSPAVGDYWLQRSTATLFTWTGTTWSTVSNINAPWVATNLADVLNSLMLRVEEKLFDGINPNARKFDFSQLEGNAAFQAEVEAELFSFGATNGLDPLAPDYNAGNAFTWNYSQLTSPVPINTSSTPARWFNYLMAHQATVAGVIPTPRPDMEPWKLFGFADHDSWWSSLSSGTQAAYTPYIRLDQIDATYITGPTVRVVKTDAGITMLSGLPVIDGVQLVSGDLVLLQNEMSPENNGIWAANSGGWTRNLTPLVEKLVVTVSSGALWKGSKWVLTATAGPTDPVIFKQARIWSSQLWADVQAAHPSLKLSVDVANDGLLPPYVRPSSGNAGNALTNFIPIGASLGYSYGQSSPIETTWKTSLEYGYSLARALFRFDPLAFLGFCWGFNWVEADGILYDGFDMNMPGHKRFRLHGDAISLISRSTMPVTGTDSIVATYTAYDDDHKQNFTVTQNGVTIGYAQNGVAATLGGVTFTIEDEGQPFRMGDRFEISNGVATFVPITTYRYLGFGQTFTHALREVSIDTTSSFAVAAFREWDVNMGYRAGGLVATDDLEIFTDSYTLSKSAYELIFKKNPIARNEWLQGLRISVTQFGQTSAGPDGTFVPPTDGSDWIFRVEGYNPRHLGITYYSMSTATDPVDFYALGKAHTSLAWLHPTVKTGTVHTNLPLTITGIQNVVNFLFGYEAYLEDQGWEFNKMGDYNIDDETGRTRTFQLEIEKFVDRCYAGITLGQGHVVNSFMDRVWFGQETGLMSEFVDSPLFDVSGHPGIFDVLGVKYKKDDLKVLRGNQESSVGAAGPIFSAHVQVDEFEHVFIFADYAQPSTSSGLLYDAFSGSRVVTYKFHGRKQATNTLRPEFGGHFLVGNEVKQNMQASADNFGNFYDANKAFENETTSRHALALLGFNTKSYFDNLDISEKTQFNFWRGLIQSKGTNMSIDAYLNNDRFDDAKIDEYWAYKVAQYGDARQKSFPELKLSVNDTVTQFTQLQFDNDTLAPAFTTIRNYDENRWFSYDDLNQPSTGFAAEVVGTFAAVGPGTITLPFIADQLTYPAGVTVNNATTVTIDSSATFPALIVGYGPARPRFNPVKLFNYVDEELVAEIPIWHPATGQHTPAALECINITSNLNPAKYNFSTQVVNNNSYDPLRPWGANEVGRVWFDTRNLAYVPYYDYVIYPEIADRLSRWGALADYASIDVYEWVESTVPPSEYNALAATQAGDASLDPNTKAAGTVANQQTYQRERVWSLRPVAWSYSPVPLNIDFEETPPFNGGHTLEAAGRLWFDDSGTTVSLGASDFATIGITSGMRIGAWNVFNAIPKPMSEYIVGDVFSKVLVDQNGGTFADVTNVGIASNISVAVSNTNLLTGQLAFYPTYDQAPILDADGVTTSYYTTVGIKAQLEDGSTDFATTTTSTDLTTTPAQVTYTAGEKILVELPAFGILITVTIAADGTYNVTDLRDAIVNGLAANLYARNSVTIQAVVPNPAGVTSPLSNDSADPGTFYGWRAWTVPTQAELDADGTYPTSSWKPYVGDYVEIPGSLVQVQDAIAYSKAPLTLNDGTIVDRYSTTWTDWSVLLDKKRTYPKLDDDISYTVVADGAGCTFTNDVNFDSTSTSVYINGVAQLKASYTISGKLLTVNSVPAGSQVVVITRKYQPTVAELAFDPDVKDNLAVQTQYKQDYEYVSLPVRDADGTFSSTLYYFWVSNKSTAARGKALSVQSIVQELRDGPDNFLTFQNMDPVTHVYDAITIAGLSYVVTKDDTFKLRFTRNFTLRDDPEEWNLKNVHTEWTLIRPGQKTLIPEALWQKLTDSVAGRDIAGNSVPAIARSLYDERNGTRTQFGFGPEQTLAPQDLLISSITYTILNTSLVDTSGASPVPDYISFLDFDQSDTWFADPVAARNMMTKIWTQAKVAQVNEIFFAALNDIVASNYELTDLFKTSRLSAYSIKVVQSGTAAATYE